MPVPPRPDEPGWQAWAEEQTIQILRAHIAEKLAAPLPSPAAAAVAAYEEPEAIELESRVIRLPQQEPQASAG